MAVRSGLFISERYEIIANIGSGGSADVYKAKDHRLNRFVAIKILKQSFAGDHKIVEKFRQEAQSCAGLTHPNIVSVYDVGNDGDLYYIVMELIEGITLKRFIEKKGRLEVKEAVGIAIQIAQGLDAAHANHVVHRDIKPQNIIISREGKVKVTDFGIARATFGTSTNTINQAPVGSVHYLSPEQARGGFSDERSDIYSLGVTIYEMLAGKVPFTGDNNVSVALLHIQGEATPLHELNPDVTPSIEKIVVKCMQKKPERRYFSASELIRDLKAAILNPTGDFVKMSSAVVNDSPTINMTREEMETIKSQSHADQDFDEDDYEQLEDDEDDELDSVNSKTEKIIVIGSIVLVALFLAVIIFFVVKNLNVFGNNNNDPAQEEVVKLTNADINKLLNGDYTLEQLTERLKNDYNIGDFSTRYEFNENVDMDHIVSLYYESNNLIVVISKGAKPIDQVIMIDVTGLNYQEAKTLLTTQLSPDITVSFEPSEEHTDEPLNTVIEQSVKEGELIALDEHIVLTYSIGPEQLTVPDLTSSAFSKSMVETQYGDSFTFKFEYDLENDYSTEQAGVVVRTEPAVGEKINKGDEITVYLSSEIVTVPDVKNIAQADAEKALTSKGFKVEIKAEYSDTVNSGLVISQSVSSDSTADRGSTITLTISKGKEPVATSTPTPTPENTPTPTPEPEITEEPEPIITEDPGEEGTE
ncbi:MAG: Stk1 family PASTA domain-containing Ser/Thr kinase [Lachnospiraceae bacterium]